MKFIINDKEYILSDERKKYNEIRNSYEVLAGYLVEEFRAKYKKENKNLEDVYENVLGQGDESVEEISEITSQYLVEEGIEGITGQELFENYRKTDRYKAWKSEVKYIRDKYLELEYGKEFLEEKKKVEEEKKEAGEDTSNIIEETLEILGDGVGKGVAYFKKGSIFKDRETLDRLSDALYETCYSMHLDYMNIVEQDKGEKIYSHVSKDNRERAEGIYEDFTRENIELSKRTELFFNMVELNPYEERYYKEMYKFSKDENGDLERLASLFNIDIIPYKLEDLSDYYRKFNLEILEEKENKPEADDFFSKMFTDEVKLRREGYIWKPVRIEIIEYIRLYFIKMTLIRYAKFINLTTENSIIEELDIEIDKYKERFKMVNGIEFETVDHAIKAKEERESIETLLSDTNLGAREEVEEAKILIEEIIDTGVKDLYLEELDEKLDKLIDREIENLIKESETGTIKNLENLIDLIGSKYTEDEGDKHIKKLKNKIRYIKTKDKVSETYEEVVDKGKKFFKNLFDGDKED